MKASAPASSANLGPGFDCLALAVELRCSVSVAPGDRWTVSPAGDDGFIVNAARELHKEPLAISIDSEIPVGRGLGSSAAVIAALATAIGRLRNGEDDLEGVFEFTAAAEGHPDNAAAAVFGGLVLSGGGSPHRLAIHDSIRPIIAVPDETLPTREARAALPDSVSIGTATRTGSRLLRLAEGLRTGDTGLLETVGPDELHEPYRIALRPIIGELMAAARLAGAPFVAMSGAGPSVIALAGEDDVSAIRTAFEGVPATRVLTPRIASQGVR
ncbi:MAG: homoserine kinase [Acidimicrobiia bacterium]|nr:homoserine kinase [Acidimicrobiia bacterium]